MACLTYGRTAIFAYYAYSSDEQEQEKIPFAYLQSVYCQPRRHRPEDMWKLRLHGVSIGLISQTANMVRHFRNDDMTWVGLNFAGTVILTVLFHFGLKLRATVGRLPDKDLENFLVDTLLKGGLKTLFSVLFIHFRTAKCVF
ncbi:hypothetical protein TrLO_g8386 [Triparma laevis f. longispina]|uniref:Uncharacterized protein n=1 Tax=Triparma laevis f. longispina TaxID=1714387 RepID=A0A9W7BXH8_9STRA|nr:hypothetical protein TrLO_g8386 [Triparma laevis f. longispina]